jgi:hypothetical protein
MKPLLFILLFLSSPLTFAQETPEQAAQATPKSKGSISGRVIGDDGQPLEGVRVGASLMSSKDPSGWRQVNTNEDGNFVVDGLTPGSYVLHAQATAFVQPEISSEPKYHRLGDFVTLNLVKGGVITGRVTNAQGEPVIAVPVQALRVRDAAGRKVDQQPYAYGRRTDDRGIYRLYGLAAGKYLVLVGGKRAFYASPPNAYEADTPTYYPSSTRDTALEISVQPGEEVGNINLRYRGEKGYSISGRVTGSVIDNRLDTGGVSILLRSYPSRTVEMQHHVEATNAERGFSFFGMADGEYELTAEVRNGWGQEEKESYTSAPRRVTVKGGNVTGVELRLAPLALASVEGKVELDIKPEKDLPAACKPQRNASKEEMIVRLRRDDEGKEEADPQRMTIFDVPNEKGEVKFRLEAGRYFVTASLPDETWYFKSIVVKPPVAKAPPPTPIDVGKQGLNLKPRDKIKDLTITITDGAARLTGRVVAAPGKALPSRVRVHLLPAEKEAAGDLLRYAEVVAKSDGAFSFANLAPGKYWMLTRPVPEEETDEKTLPPAAWNAATRALLRRAAETGNNIIELKNCQRVDDFTLKFAP